MLVSPESQRLPNLLVFAHADEASAFDDIAHVVTGVGKVHAATELAHELANAGWAGVTVLGTAGIVGSVSTAHAEAAGNGAAGTEATDLEVTDPEPASSAAVLPLDLDTVYQIDAVLQHDFALPSPTLRPMGELICDPTPSEYRNWRCVRCQRHRAGTDRSTGSLVGRYGELCIRRSVRSLQYSSADLQGALRFCRRCNDGYRLGRNRRAQEPPTSRILGRATSVSFCDARLRRSAPPHQRILQHHRVAHILATHRQRSQGPQRSWQADTLLCGARHLDWFCSTHRCGISGCGNRRLGECRHGIGPTAAACTSATT